MGLGILRGSRFKTYGRRNTGGEHVLHAAQQLLVVPQGLEKLLKVGYFGLHALELRGVLLQIGSDLPRVVTLQGRLLESFFHCDPSSGL
ncbi:hypothetical protein ADK75_05455 [Streptomyces virginiae]|uniref:Uncharacterized protein n=1 Tax=Streptomyces virginiae TaxID=1961 RepID=A0A0L8N352_STRVG|nr:hypothetical protein ADK75_05455 [Streptomyces virginiae]